MLVVQRHLCHGLAGFKMACLQYAPGPVVYESTTYSRAELIRMRIDLLNQAKEHLLAESGKRGGPFS